jgi:hypothetical protein
VPGGAEPVRVPATFRVVDGGRLSPPTVSAPAFLAIELSVTSADGRAHTVQLKADRTYGLRVPAGGRGSVRLRGQRAGEYPVIVDGRPGGRLAIGGEPGP